MGDLDGLELQVGDRVAYQRGDKNPNLIRTTVTGFTPEMVITGVGVACPFKLVKMFRQGDNS